MSQSYKNLPKHWHVHFFFTESGTALAISLKGTPVFKWCNHDRVYIYMCNNCRKIESDWIKRNSCVLFPTQLCPKRLHVRSSSAVAVMYGLRDITYTVSEKTSTVNKVLVFLRNPVKVSFSWLVFWAQSITRNSIKAFLSKYDTAFLCTKQNLATTMLPVVLPSWHFTVVALKLPRESQIPYVVQL